MTKKFNVYEAITAKFVASLKEGYIPWKKPYRGTEGVFNHVTKREYHGINSLLLGMNPYMYPGYATYKQIQKMGGSVRKGERGSMVVYWSILEKKNKESEKIETIPFLKYFTVFNMEQTTGIDFELKTVPSTIKDISCAEEIVNDKRTPEIQFVGGTPRYISSTDEIKVPIREQFNSSEEMYSTIFHELAHSVAHPSRLNQNTSNYAKEELTAEITASFLSHHCNLGDAEQKNSEAYIKSWIQNLNNDPKMIIQASGKAVKRVEFILNKKDETT